MPIVCSWLWSLIDEPLDKDSFCADSSPELSLQQSCSSTWMSIETDQVPNWIVVYLFYLFLWRSRLTNSFELLDQQWWHGSHVHHHFMEGIRSTALHLLDPFLSPLPGGAVLGGWGFDFDPLKLDRETLEPFGKNCQERQGSGYLKQELWVLNATKSWCRFKYVHSTYMWSMLDFI